MAFVLAVLLSPTPPHRPPLPGRTSGYPRFSQPWCRPTPGRTCAPLSPFLQPRPSRGPRSRPSSSLGEPPSADGEILVTPQKPARQTACSLFSSSGPLGGGSGGLKRLAIRVRGYGRLSTTKVQNPAVVLWLQLCGRKGRPLQEGPCQSPSAQSRWGRGPQGTGGLGGQWAGLQRFRSRWARNARKSSPSTKLPVHRAGGVVQQPGEGSIRSREHLLAGVGEKLSRMR